MSHGERLDPPCNPRLDAAWEHHMETCEFCVALERDRHLEDCSECGHAWHGGKPCGFVTLPNAVYGKSSDPCECYEDGGLSDSRIADFQAKCFHDEQEALRDEAAEQKYQRYRD
jgi:hypothetical protein